MEKHSKRYHSALKAADLAKEYPLKEAVEILAKFPQAKFDETVPEKALAAGADHAGLAELMAKVQSGWLDFDVAIATNEAMKQVRTLARILGPKGLMPNPKSGTVTDDVAAGIKAVKAGRVEFKVDKTANIGVGIGKRSFTPAQILENATAVIVAVGKAKPAAFKGHYIKSATISSSMSPGVKIASTEFSKY